MNGLYDAALEIQQFLEGRGWRFCIIGGLALIRWGQPRATQDVDVILKAFAGRAQDWVDIENVATRQAERLDWDYIGRELEALSELAADADLADRVQDIRRRSARVQ